MLNVRAFRKIVEVLQENPLEESLRTRTPKERQIPFLGYRDAITCGDLRQLLPASGEAPFFSTPDFHLLFEFFLLTEDRRHEKEPAMQRLKELIAWGGVECDATEAELAGDGVHCDVKDFVDEGYLRGWGLTGRSVDLDVGTAIFALKKDVTSTIGT